MLAPEFVTNWGGVGTYILELIAHLPQRFEFIVLTTNRPPLSHDERQPDKSSLRIRPGIRVLPISEARDTFLYNAAFQYACWRNVPRLLKTEQVDIIHSHYAHMPDVLLRLVGVNVPILTTVHTTIASQREGTRASGLHFGSLERSEKFTLGMYPIFEMLERLYFSRGGMYVTPSRWMKNGLKSKLCKKATVKVVRNSVDLANYSTKSSEPGSDIEQLVQGRRVVLYCGRLLAMKGVNTLIRSIPRVLELAGDMNPLFIFAGPGSATPYMRYLKELRVNPDNYFFAGPLKRQEVFSLMRRAALLVVPSFMENSPFTILEGMACGTPVVATNVGGIPEIIRDRHDGLLVNPGSSHKLSEAIFAVLTDPSLASVLTNNAKRTIRERFSWPANLSDYVTMYEEACGA